jgi:hypothetical protein
MEEPTTDLGPVRIRLDLANDVADALTRRAAREDRTVPAEAARLVRQALEAAGELHRSKAEIVAESR